jgi:lipid-binding SYLF domain-containing protein
LNIFLKLVFFLILYATTANHVLEYALNPGIRGIPKGFFMDCAGICIMSLVEVGFMFSGSVGTGIVIAKNDDGSWSCPVACGLTGVGFGIVLGAAAKDLIIFMADKASLQTFFSTGLKLAGQTNVTVGVGRDFEGSFGASASGMSSTLSIAYSKGAFISCILEGAVVAPRKACNEKFYGLTGVQPADIIDGKITFPSNKNTLMPNVLDKLGKLAQGLTEVPGGAEKQKVEAAKAEADKASEEINKGDDVVEIDAQAEAAKGK